MERKPDHGQHDTGHHDWLRDQVILLVREMTEKLCSMEHRLEHIHHTGERIMSAISTFAAAVKESFADLQGDLAALNAKIEQLQNTQGQITPEDQGLLDEIQQMAQALAAVTPPTPPTNG